jgi:PPOX class probable F420-dependent enzyme
MVATDGWWSVGTTRDEPAVDRPDMPPGYGPQEELEGTLAWTWAERQLIDARNYWVATTTRSGTPHVVPVWGVWVHDALWFGTDPASAKGRNLRRDPRLVVHLESGDEVVIVHGRADVVSLGDLEAAVAGPVDDAYAAKYNDVETGEPLRLSGGPEGSLVHRVVPERVLGWLEHDFLRTRTRWRFGT